MARKSRKASIQAVLGGAPLLVSESAAMRTAIWNTAGYARLSIMETRDRKDSEALSNQKDLLCGYIGQKQDLKLCGLYADNGETGTNFDRSDFQRLMADIQAGKINCIVVKDSCVIIDQIRKALKKLGFSGLVPSFLTERGQ